MYLDIIDDLVQNLRVLEILFRFIGCSYFPLVKPKIGYMDYLGQPSFYIEIEFL